MGTRREVVLDIEINIIGIIEYHQPFFAEATKPIHCVLVCVAKVLDDSDVCKVGIDGAIGACINEKHFRKPRVHVNTEIHRS